MRIEEPSSPRLVEHSLTGADRVVDTPEELAEAVRRLAGGTGPLGADTERASGFRYSQRAYLLQLYREGSGTVLLDPIAFDDLNDLVTVLDPLEWILHAAPQDLPAIHELGFRPAALFDTELAARLLNLPRVGLGGLVEDLLAVHLRKEHSAADWSTRPLPHSWIDYAALDVEYLPRLREAEIELLRGAGKLEIAHAEFEYERTSPPRPPSPHPWTRLSGLHALHGARQERVARELWRTRERIARQRDVSPHRLIPDRAIIAAARATAGTPRELLQTPGFNGRAAKSLLDEWWQAIRRGEQSQEPLPAHHGTGDVPPHRQWHRLRPEAARRLQIARSDLQQTAKDLDMPHEQLLRPASLRAVCWRASSPASLAEVRRLLVADGARPWQIDRVAPVILAALADADDVGEAAAAVGAARPAARRPERRRPQR